MGLIAEWRWIEYGVSNFEDRGTETIWSEEERENKWEKKMILKDLWGKIAWGGVKMVK